MANDFFKKNNLKLGFLLLGFMGLALGFAALALGFVDCIPKLRTLKKFTPFVGSPKL